MKTLSLILLAIFAVFLFFHAWSSWDWESTTNSSPKLVTDGTEYGGWTYDSRNITANSVVYSVGLGEDTSWDEGIMNRFGVQVWGFDPTPKSIKYVHSNKANGNLGPTFILHRKDWGQQRTGFLLRNQKIPITCPCVRENTMV